MSKPTSSTAVALLPTRTNIDPSHPLDNEYFTEDSIGYILGDLRGKPRRVIGGYGSRPESGFEYGTQHEFFHDQEGYTFGYLRVIGWFNGKGEGSGADDPLTPWQGGRRAAPCRAVHLDRRGRRGPPCGDRRDEDHQMGTVQADQDQAVDGVKAQQVRHRLQQVSGTVDPG